MSVTKIIAATIKLTVPAGRAWAAARVGPKLRPYGLNVTAFCKDFNERTQKFSRDTPINVSITAYEDKTFEFTVKSPSTISYLKIVSGMESGSSSSRYQYVPHYVTAPSITLRHVYEIAKVQQADDYSRDVPLDYLSKSIIRTANKMGIKIVKDLHGK